MGGGNRLPSRSQGNKAAGEGSLDQNTQVLHFLPQAQQSSLLPYDVGSAQTHCRDSQYLGYQVGLDNRANHFRHGPVVHLGEPYICGPATGPAASCMSQHPMINDINNYNEYFSSTGSGHYIPVSAHQQVSATEGYPTFSSTYSQGVAAVASSTQGASSPIFNDLLNYPHLYPTPDMSARTNFINDPPSATMIQSCSSPGSIFDDSHEITSGSSIERSLSATARAPSSSSDDFVASSSHSVDPDTPGSVLSSPGSTPPYSSGPPRRRDTMSSLKSLAYRDAIRGDNIMSFPRARLLANIICGGQVVTPKIDAKVVKNVFHDGYNWTCYRRNYIAVECSYTLDPLIPNGILFLNSGRGMQRLQALAVSLTATVDSSNGKEIDLIQHTPKRDKGPLTKVSFQRLSPMTSGSVHSPYINNSATAGPLLLYQHDGDTRSVNATGHSYNQHTFERIQFKSATANNGRRRAQQQYFHLMVELYADVRTSADEPPRWVKIAQRISDSMIVRGRSPGHYQERRGCEGHAGGFAGDAGGCCSATITGSQHGRNSGVLSPDTEISSFLPANLLKGSNKYHSRARPAHLPSVASQSGPSMSCANEFRSHQTAAPIMTETESSTTRNQQSHHYLPSPIFATPSTLKPNGLFTFPECTGSMTILKDAYTYGEAGDSWNPGGHGIYQATPGSHSHYPTTKMAY